MSLLNYKKIGGDKLSLERDTSRKVTYQLKYNDEDILIKTPHVNCCSELIVDVEQGQAYLDIEMPNKRDFYNLFSIIDKYILEYVSSEKGIPYHRVEENFKPTIMQRNGRIFIRVRLLLSDNLPVAKIYDINNNLVDVEKHNLDEILKSGDKLMLLISPEKVRISNSTVKCNWYVQQMRVFRKISDCLLSDSESESETENESDTEEDD